jgi:hypothetical protein
VSGEQRPRSDALHPKSSSLESGDLTKTGASEAVLRSGGDVKPGFVLPALCVATLLAVAAVLSFLSGGYILQRTAPVVFALVALIIVAVWRVRALVLPSRPYLFAVAAFAALVAWSGLSLLWSVGPDLTWVSFDVALLYLLVMIVVGVLPGGQFQLRLAAYGFGVVVLVIAGYSLLGKVAPDVVSGTELFARLREPVGYWNVLAAMIVMATPILLVAASGRATRPWIRGMVSAALVVLVFTFFFTFSRGAYVALAAALIVYFVLTTRRLAAIASLAIPVALAGVVLFALRDLNTLFSASMDSALRSSQAHTFALWLVVALVAAFALQVLVALAERRWTLSAHQARIVGMTVIAVLVVVPLALGGAYVLGHGGGEWFSVQYHAALSSSGPTNDVQRLGSLGTSGRAPWYREALRGFSHHPITGTGAGTFRFTNDLYRTDDLIAKHSHSQWLNELTELGAVGLVLFAVAIGGLVLAALGRPLRGRLDPQRSLLAACQAAVIAFVVHMSIDWDWDMTAITIGFLVLAGVSASYAVGRTTFVRQATQKAEGAGSGPTRAPALRTSAVVPSLGLRLLATALLLFAVVCWALPFFAERATASAQDRLSRGQVASAEAAARRAAALDPLAVDPLLTLATAQAQAGDPKAAATTLERAVRMQPDNYEPYYQMGNLQFRSFGNKAAARLWYLRALQLSPMNAGVRHMLGEL